MMTRPLARSIPYGRRSTRLTRHIQSLLAELERPVAVERRHYDRVAVPFLLRLTPLDADGQPLADQAVTVVGKDISRRGLCFFHEHSLPYRRSMVELEHPGMGRLFVEVDICWCRFSRLGWYESGGHLTRLVEQPPAAPVAGVFPAAIVADTSAPAMT